MKQGVFTILLCVLAFTPLVFVSAQQADYEYSSLVNLQGFFGGSSNVSAEEFVTILYTLSITLAALLAVMKIIYGGVQYMLTDVVTSKEQAKKDIWGAVFGLVIVLSAIFILNIINPQLSQVRLFRGPQNTPPAQSAPQSDVQTTQPDPLSVGQEVEFPEGPGSAVHQSYLDRCIAGEGSSLEPISGGAFNNQKYRCQ